MKAFGERLKTALEELDHKVVKLKAPGLQNPSEYEQVLGV